ncbi:MAG: hypothetical protein AAF944_23145 [Bacteroidota bacterium]
MITSILKFELASRLRRPLFLVFFALMAFQSIWFLQGSYEVYINDATNMNGAVLFYRSFAGGGIIMTIIIAIVTGSALYKDIQYKSAGIIYTTPVGDKTFFMGRFLSAYAINLILGFGLFVGMALAPYSGIGAADKFGPTPWSQMFFGFFVFTATNLFIYTAVSISFLVLTKRMAASYLSIFFITLLFFICETLRPDSSHLELLQILDPSSFVYTTTTIDTIPINQRNEAYLPLNNMFLLNRTVWLGFSIIMLWIAYRSFTFKRFIAGNTGSRKRRLVSEKQFPLAGINSGVLIPKVQLSYRFTDFLSKLLRFSWLEIKNVVRTSGFRVLIFILSIVFFLSNLLWNSSLYIGSSYPLTSTMTLTRISMGTWVSLILMIWTTELLFKDRVVGFWQVKDALPVPVWVNMLSKFLAMSVVTLLISCMFIVFGIVAQLLKGAPEEINLTLYFTDLLGYNWGWLNYLQMLALVCLVAGLTAHRFATYIISIWIYFFNMVSFDLKIIEELRFIYMFVPGVDDYSEMNGYGIWETSIPWFFLLWTTLATAFVAMGIYFWKRGESSRFFQKFTFRGDQLNWIGKSLVGVSLVTFLYLQFFIISNVHAYGNFETERQEQEKDARYEKKYKYLTTLIQPRITSLDLKLDFYPSNRSAEFLANYTLRNFHQTTVDTLYLNLPDFTTYQELVWEEQKLQPAWVDEELNIIALAVNIPGDATSVFQIKGSRKHVGFTQDKETQQPELTYNGSFLRAQDLLPVLGYDDNRELTENRYRNDWGLEKLHSRMQPITDSTALSADVFSPDAIWLNGSIELSTAADQVAIAPGKLIKSWQADDKNYFRYSLEAPAPFEWYFGSANYSQFSFDYEKVQCHIYHKPEHAYNVPFFKNSLSTALDFINTKLSDYPYSEVKLIEIPFYQDPHYTFPNTIAISEKEGWFADSTSLDNRVYMDFTVASNLIAHWVMQNVPIANVQGADMLRNALPECLAMQIIDDIYGQEGIDWLLTKKTGVYSRERGNEPNVEQPLIKADGIEYLERNKGTIELYQLSEAIGADQFNYLVKTWAEGLEDKATFHDLYLTLLASEMIAKLPEKDIQAIKTGFEKVSP